MRAVRVNEWGGPEVLKIGEVRRPIPGDDQVLIRVHAASVNPLDWKIRAGHMKAVYSTPFIPGCDVAGVIEEAGAAVNDLKQGDAVYSMIGRSGGYAELAVAKAALVAPKPRALDYAQAAAVPLVALTAWQMLFEQGGLKSGQRVLVHAAAGGVGSFAVQFARHAGAQVYGTASAKNADFLRSIGAEPIDYQSQRFEDAVRDIDLVIDLLAGETQDRSWRVMKPGGTLVCALGEPNQEKAKAAGVQGRRVSVRPDGQQLREIGRLIEAGHVKVEVSRTFPLEQVAEAHNQVAAGHTRGKVVLTL